MYEYRKRENLTRKRNQKTMTTVYSPMQQVFETDDLVELIYQYKREQEAIDAEEEKEINRRKELCKKIYPVWQDKNGGFLLWLIPEGIYSSMKRSIWCIILNDRTCYVLVWRRAQNNALTYGRVKGAYPSAVYINDWESVRLHNYGVNSRF